MQNLIVIGLLCVFQVPASPKGIKLERLTTSDAAPVLGADAVVLIPIGAGLEPHGAHLALGSDLSLAEHLSHRVMESTNVVLAPALPYHFSAATVRNPGTTTLLTDTARDATVEIVRSLSRSGPRRFYSVYSGTAGAKVLADAAAIVARDGILLRFSDLSAHVGPHARERETSMLLHIDPPAVKMERTDGDSSGAAALRGKIYIDAAVEALVREVESLRRATPPDVQPEAPPPAPAAPATPAEPRRPSGCTAGDERSITDLATRLGAYWARRDADQLAELWSEDGDLVHPDGVVERGRPIIRDNRRDQFRRKEYGASKHFVRFGVIRCPTPDIAVADGKWELSGVYDAAGNLMPRGDGPLTVVLKKFGGTWLFEAYRYSVTLTQQGPKPPTLLKKPGYPDK